MSRFKSSVAVAFALGLTCSATVAQVTSKADQTVTVVEYYNAALDHYFMTSLSSEIAICDIGQPPCVGWVRTGESFQTWAPGTINTSSNPGVLKVCRLFNDNYAGTSTHFYALTDYHVPGFDCNDTLTEFPDWQLETDELFDANAFLDPSFGTCAPTYIQLYRLYNNGAGGAPNHRFTSNTMVVQQTYAKGWTFEGAVMCIPNIPGN
ncbi:MAG TPA: hypothetical protein VIH36_10610 [Casimicrobiaceae bacterium]